MQAVSTLFGLVLGFFLNFAEWHRLFKRLADFIQAFVIEVMHTLGALGIQVDQFVVFTHGLAYVVVRMTQ